MISSEVRQGNNLHNKQIVRLIGDFPKVKINSVREILSTTIASKPIVGSIPLQELADYFGNNQGISFSGEDGFYTVSDLSKSSAGNVIRVKTIPQGKTLWYPTGLEDVWEVLKEFQHFAGSDAWMNSLDEVRAHKVPRPSNVTKYLDEAESKALSKYKVVDFGGGDFRLSLVSAACGLDSSGIEIDEELLEMASQNIAAAKRKKTLIGNISQIKGSFLDDDIIEEALQRSTLDSKVLCYLYTTPITEELIVKLMPHLKKDDYIITYREMLSRKKNFSQISGRLDIKMETPGFMINETPINIYRVNS